MQLNGDFNRLYRDWKAWNSIEFGEREVSLDRYFEAELAAAGISVGPGRFLIEIGFGNGSFAAWAISKGVTYTGTEVDDVLIARAVHKGYDVHSATLDLSSITAGRSIDCIVAFDVIEHLPVGEAIELLRSAASCLADDGRILIRVPSGDSPFGRSIQYSDMTHRTVLGSGMIRQLAALASLEVIQIRPPAFPLWGLGVLKFVRRAPVAIARALIAKSINLIFNDNQPRVVTPNMTAVFRKVQGAAKRPPE